MSTLTFLEKSKLERLLGMGSGYVLEFSNNSFASLIADVAKRDIYDEKYAHASGSKANRLRKFWELEPDHIVAKVVSALVEFAAENTKHDTKLIDECRQIASRLASNSAAIDLSALLDDPDADLERVAAAVQKSIDDHEPELGLDRLHTFTTKVIRRACEARGISTTKDKPLHSLMGEYLKAVRASGELTTAMAERILKSTISLLEAFNDVRNDHSLAHDNPILDFEEAMLIFTSTVAVLRFIEALERERKRRTVPKQDDSLLIDDDLPF